MNESKAVTLSEGPYPRAIPIGRYGIEGELDTTVIYLASPASSYVNGMNIAVDGGYTAI